MKTELEVTKYHMKQNSSKDLFKLFVEDSLISFSLVIEWSFQSTKSRIPNKDFISDRKR